MEQYQKQRSEQYRASEGYLYDIPFNNIGLRDVLAVIYLVKGPEGTISTPGAAYDWADRLLHYREEG